MTDLTIDKRLLAEYDTNSQRQVRIDACLWCISNQRHALYPSETIVSDRLQEIRDLVSDIISVGDESRARLIAAAPDLLDELKSILSALESKGIAPQRQASIRQVIAKATVCAPAPRGAS